MGRILRATIRVTAIAGDYPVPTSEAQYLANQGLIDTVMPYGAALNADGTWSSLGSPSAFSTSLPGRARTAGQRYVPRLDPGHYTDGSNLKSVLDDPAKQALAVAGAVTLAQSNFDAPWDGVLYDVLDTTGAYIALQDAFIVALATGVRDAGFSFEIDYRGVRPADEATSASLDVIRDTADEFDYYMFGWWLAPCSTGPYWWAVESLDNALNHGLDPASIYLGIPNYARSWTAGYASSQDMTHDQAMGIARDNGATLTWIEDHATGQIREKYARIGDGHLWVQDGSTVQQRLNLVDEYNLGGMMLFVPGMGDESVWRAIAEWKQHGMLGRMTAQKLSGCGGVFSPY